MAKLIHSMIRVLELKRSTDFYAALGLRESHKLDFPEFTLVYLRGDEVDSEIELTMNKDRTEPYDLGDGYGHCAFAVDDLDSEHTRLMAAGLVPTPIKEFNDNGELLARFFFVTDPDGYKIEILERHGHYQ